MGLFDVFKKRKKEFVRSKQMEVLFCFLKDSFSCGDILNLMEQSEEFKPAAVSRVRDFVTLTPGVYEEIKNGNPFDNEELLFQGLSFLDQNNKQRVHFHISHNREKCQELNWQFDSMQFLESALFKKLIAHEKFIAAYCYNQEDQLFQNMTAIFYLEDKGIKPLATRLNQYGQLEADIDKNPGRAFLTHHTWLISAWRMWFGKNFYTLVPKEKILGFDKAWSIKEHDNMISVQLYENHEAFDNSINRQIQMSFREWMEFPRLAANDK